MKYGIFVVLLLCIGIVSASDVCTDKGFGHTVSFWTYDSGFVNVNGSSVDVYGTAHKAYWNSTILINSVVYRSGNRTYTLDGGLNGAIPKTTLKYDIQSINFCSDELEVPEFGIIAGVAAMIGAVGVYVYRKR